MFSLSIAQKQNILYMVYVLLTSLVVALIYHQTQSKWIYFRAAENQYLLKNYEQAISLYQKSLAEGETNDKTKLHLADSYVAEGDFSKAIAIYKVYLSYYPDVKDVRLALARALFWNGNLEESEVEYKKVVNTK